MEIPEWLPDWRDQRQYPDPEKDSLILFAWEFLRRNPEYQADYHRVWGSLSESERRWAIESIVAVLPGEKEEDYRQRWDTNSVTARETYTKVHPLGWLANKWGYSDGLALWSLGDGLDPSISRPAVITDITNEKVHSGETPCLSFELESSPAISPGGFDYAHWNELRIVQMLVTKMGETLESLLKQANTKTDDNDYKTKCRVEIDLLLPIDVQLDRLKTILKHSQKQAKENGFESLSPRMPRKLQIYLRVLDAKLTCESNSDIAVVLYPDKLDEYDSGFHASDSVKKDLKVALAYRDRRYRELALLLDW